MTSFWILHLSIYILESGHFPGIPQEIGHRFPLHMVPTDLPGLDPDSGVSSRDPQTLALTPSSLPPWRGSLQVWSGEILLLPGRLSPKSSKAKGFSIP